MCIIISLVCHLLSRWLSSYTSILKKEAIHPTETFVDFHGTHALYAGRHKL
jgi:hypothetical protein